MLGSLPSSRYPDSSIPVGATNSGPICRAFFFFVAVVGGLPCERLLPLLCADVEDPLDEQGWLGVEVVGIAVDEIEFIVAAQVMQRE